MSNQYITMNSVSFNPTSVDYEQEKIGESRRMGDGTLRYYHRATKAKWTITWTAVKETYLTAIRNIAALNTSFTFIDHNGTSYTVIVLPGGFKHTLTADKVDAIGVKRYDITLTLSQV